MNIQIDKNNNIPVYKQIVNQLIEAMESSAYKNGDKLPSERILSGELEVSRGTITKAYNELANLELVTLVKGKGCFVSDEKTFLSLGRKEKAVHMIKNTIENLQELGFSMSEIRIFSEIVMMEKEKNYSAIRIGIIDCNREALHAVQRQIGKLKDITISKYLLTEITSTPLQDEIRGFDMLITTYKHYEEILEVLPTIEEKLIRVAMSPSKKTMIEIARVAQNKNIGILYDSKNYLGVIRNELKLVDIQLEDSMHLMIEDLNKKEISSFVKNKEIIIVPPLTFFDVAFQRWLMLHLENKQVIEFDYLIERGNLLFLEETIRRLMIKN